MLSDNLFTKEEEKVNQVERSLLSLLNLNKVNNRIFEVDNLEDSNNQNSHILKAEDAIQISTTVSYRESKNVFLINGGANKILQNLNHSLVDNFLKVYRGFLQMIPKFADDKSKEISVTVLNMVSPESRDIKNDITLLRSLNKVNIFVPADANEAEYLLKISENTFFKNVQNNFSYFRLSNAFSAKIFEDDFFTKENNLREYTGMPEIVYISRNIDSIFHVAIITSGPILYNALLAAKELENKNYNVTVLNVSLISSNSEYVNQKIKSFIVNFANTHKNIVTVEEHSKNGGLGSMIAETISENKNDKVVRVERLGLEEDLSPRNIISKCEEICGW